MNLLVMLSLAGAAALGEWAEGATLAFLYSLAGMLEALSLERARRSVARLLELIPAQASLVQGTTSTGWKPNRWRLERACASAPAIHPCDGVVLEGEALVDQSPLTGEDPVPAETGR